MAQRILRHGEILISLSVLLELLRHKDALGHGLAVDGDGLVLFVEQLDVLGLPLVGGWVEEAEEDEAAVALDVDGHALDGEALCDGRLHLAHATLRGQVDVRERAVLAVHDEIAVGSPLDADFNKLLDREASGPCCSPVGLAF